MFPVALTFEMQYILLLPFTDFQWHYLQKHETSQSILKSEQIASLFFYEARVTLHSS